MLRFFLILPILFFSRLLQSVEDCPPSVVLCSFLKEVCYKKELPSNWSPDLMVYFPELFESKNKSNIGFSYKFKKSVNLFLNDSQVLGEQKEEVLSDPLCFKILFMYLLTKGLLVVENSMNVKQSLKFFLEMESREKFIEKHQRLLFASQAEQERFVIEFPLLNHLVLKRIDALRRLAKFRLAFPPDLSTEENLRSFLDVLLKDFLY